MLTDSWRHSYEQAYNTEGDKNATLNNGQCLNGLLAHMDFYSLSCNNVGPTHIWKQNAFVMSDE